MQEKELKEKIKELIEFPLLKKNIEIVSLEWKKGKGRGILRIFIDKINKPGTITIEDCAKASQLIGRLLDEKDLIHTSYFLEVSSPGINRPLVKREDFDRFKGEKVKISLKTQISGRKNFKGILLGIDKEGIVKVEIEGKVWKLPFEEIKKANLERDIEF